MRPFKLLNPQNDGSPMQILACQADSERALAVECLRTNELANTNWQPCEQAVLNPLKFIRENNGVKFFGLPRPADTKGKAVHPCW
jgi:hypothetical protein